MSNLTISEDVTGGISNAAFSALQERAERQGQSHLRGDEQEDYSDKEDLDGDEEYDEGEEEYEESEDHEAEEINEAEDLSVPFNAAWENGNEKRRRNSVSSSQDLSLTKRVNIGEHVPEFGSDEQAYKVLHRVECHSKTHHIFKLFEDVPIRGSMGHLNGFDPLRHVEEHISKYPNLTFLIIKEHYCKSDDAWCESSGTASAGYSRSNHHYSENGLILAVDEDLKNAISEVSKSYLYQNNEEMCPPYVWLFHHRSELLSKANASESVASHKIRSLLDYTNDRYGMLYAKADRQQNDGFVDQETIPFLFRPNQLLISYIKSERIYDRTPTWRGLVLETWPSYSRNITSLRGWFYKHNSTHATRESMYLDVPNPETCTRIQKLATYPFEYADYYIRNELIARGKRYWEYRTIQNVCYNGWDEKEELLLTEARLMVDYIAYRQLHPYSSYWKESHKSRKYDSWPSTLGHDQYIYPNTYALFPTTLHGFLLKEKKWITIQIDQVSPICWNKKAFEHLVLPERTKELIKSLVLVRTTEIGESKGLSIAGKRKDMIAGKGNGLIMLLHGAPGTGKTLTAERFAFSLLRTCCNSAESNLVTTSVAEIAEKPLYNVTCGDIGTNAEEVEKYLKSVLFLGKMWNCILLLDEADVFLEERSLSDLKRNSLVSVFLRTLEYYDGILILTSNRVGTFDEAFSSRIQVSLHFPLLDRPSRRQIWLNFLEILREDKEEIDFAGIERRIEELSDLEMNGRQIRNVLTTARQLAMYKMVTMEWEHVQKAVRSAADFTKYIQTVHGHTDEQNARDEKLR